MARPWRIEYEGALYHVFSSGNEQRAIFETAEDRVNFLLMLGRMADRFRIDIFGYVLIYNHYDVLLRTQTPNLARAMHWFGTAYTRRFNLDHSRSGHLFQGRYRGTLVENAEGVAELSCHIHLKPVRLKLVEDPADYPWSSYNAYAFDTPLPIRIDRRFVLSVMPGPDRHSSYREMALRLGTQGGIVLRKLHHGMLYGSREFVSRIRSTYMETGPNPEVTGQRKVFCDRDPQTLLDAVTAALEPVEGTAVVDDERTECDLRMFFLWRTGIFKNRDIGALCGLSHSAVSRRVKSFEERIRDDEGLADKISALGQELKVSSIRRQVSDRASAMKKDSNGFGLQ
jgi:hypothetical protein